MGISINIKKFQIDFAYWINNNFYKPSGTDGNWELEIEHPEFSGKVPEVNIFSTEDLHRKFSNREGVF